MSIFVSWTVSLLIAAGLLVLPAGHAPPYAATLIALVGLTFVVASVLARIPVGRPVVVGQPDSRAFALTAPRLTRSESWLAAGSLAAYAALLVPLLIATVHAVQPTAHATAVARWMVYALAIYVALRATVSEQCVRLVLVAALLSGLAWSLYAIGQYFFGIEPRNPATFAAETVPTFFRYHFPHGLYQAHLLAFALAAAWWLLRGRIAPWLVVLLILTIPIALGQNRMGWFLLGLTLLGVLAWFVSERRFWTLGLVAACAVIVTVVGVWVLRDWIGEVLPRTLGLFSGDPEAIDRALSGRLSIWIETLKLAQEQGFWGSGYKALPALSALTLGSGPPSHPHLFALEAWLTAGLPGLGGLFAASVLLPLVLWLSGTQVLLAWKATRLAANDNGDHAHHALNNASAIRREDEASLIASAERNARAVLFFVTLGSALLLLPFNAHWSLYATNYTGLFIVLWCAAIYVVRGMPLVADRFAAPQSSGPLREARCAPAPNPS